VNEFIFTVHFTLHRNEKTVGKKTNLIIVKKRKMFFFLLYIAFYTSELVENQRVSFMRKKVT